MKKPLNQTTLKEDAGKLLQDIGKLIFGSIFLGGVLKGELPQDKMLIIGFIGAVIFCVSGLILAAKKKNAGEYPPAKQEK